MPARVTPHQSRTINARIRELAPKVADIAELTRLLATEGHKMTRDSIDMRVRRLGVSLAVASPTGDVEQMVLGAIKKRKAILTVESIADLIDVGPSKVRTALKALEGQGYNVNYIDGNIELSSDIPKAPPLKIDARKLEGKTYRFGLTADNHLASKYSRLDVLECLFDYWESQGIDTVYQLGNMIDGEARFNRQDIVAFGLEGQAQYFADNWPKRKGIKTYYITGDDHEGWYVQRELLDVGHYLMSVAQRNGRNDLIYLGHMEHDILFKGSKGSSTMRLIHAGGGSAYATSYSVQKIVESYQGGEKPSVLLVGHYHKAEYGYPREVHVVQAGCTCDQTPFMRKNKLQAHVGGWTIEMTLNDDGQISRFRTEWIPFYDKKFYANPWRYQPLTEKKRKAVH